MTDQTKAPTSFWIISIVALIWNLMGLWSFFAHWKMPQSVKDAMKPEALALMESYPSWTYIVFAIATFGGLLGCILLLMRKSAAKQVFLISLVAILIQMGYSLFMTNSIEVYGTVQAMIMPILIILIGIYLVYFSGKSIANGWIR